MHKIDAQPPVIDSPLTCANCRFSRQPNKPHERVTRQGIKIPRICQESPPGPNGFPMVDASDWCGKYDKRPGFEPGSLRKGQ